MPQLHKDGWMVLVIWECQMKDKEKLKKKLEKFLK
jgi:G:T-mismatch repair DNA endonuclease (very short patch repair protein)